MFTYQQQYLCVFISVLIFLVSVSEVSSKQASVTSSSRVVSGRGGSARVHSRTSTRTGGGGKTKTRSRVGGGGSFFDDFHDDDKSQGSFSRGSTFTSGDGKAFVQSSTHVSSGGKRKQPKGKTTTKGGKTSRHVEVGEGTVKSSSHVSGKGSVSASSSAYVGPDGKRGSASTTQAGKTRTITRGREEKSKSGVDVCRGLAKFKCCDDQKFNKFGKRVYCGCWGDGRDRDFCFFERVSEDPLIIEDIFGANKGYQCECEDIKHPRCVGIMRRECCEGYNGKAKKCYCTSGDRQCHYERISTKPLVWRDTRFGRTTCKC